MINGSSGEYAFWLPACRVLSRTTVHIFSLASMFSVHDYDDDYGPRFTDYPLVFRNRPRNRQPTPPFSRFFMGMRQYHHLDDAITTPNANESSLDSKVSDLEGKISGTLAPTTIPAIGRLAK